MGLRALLLAWALSPGWGGLARAEGASGEPAGLDTAPSTRELAQWGTYLGSADLSKRRAAHDAFLGLGADALGAIRGRLSQISGQLDLPGALSAVSAFRRVQGAASPDAEVDLVQGVWPTLGHRRDQATLQAAELVLVLRALEAQKSPEAAELIVGQLFAVAPKLFRYEAPRTLARLGVVVVPALVRCRTQGRPWLRNFCAGALVDMHMDAPGRAVQQDDVVLLSALLTAYGDTLAFDAMPVIVSYLTDERVAVREAARTAIRHFGKNAIWQLRERYLNATGAEANPNWGHQRILAELSAMHDGPRKKRFEAALRQAEQALARGDLEATALALDQALDAEPEAARAKVASPVYARLGQGYFDRGDTGRSLTAFRRALRLFPVAPDRAWLEARVHYLEAELRLERGVVDLPGYARALALDPGLAPAAEALDVVSGEREERARLWRRGAGFCAALLMLIAAVALVRGPRPHSPEGSTEGG